MSSSGSLCGWFFFLKAKDGIRGPLGVRGVGDGYKRKQNVRVSLLAIWDCGPRKEGVYKAFVMIFMKNIGFENII